MKDEGSLLKEMEEIEREIEEIKKRIPPHSVKYEVVQLLEEKESQLERKRELLKAKQVPTDMKDQERQLVQKVMKGTLTSSGEEFKNCIEFHGHTCPGLAIGFRAARTLMERLEVRKAPDEELVAIVETDACGADAIQAMTGCTFGKGNFLFKNYGKHAFSLIDRRKGKGMRVCLQSDAFKIDPESLSLSEKVQKDEASAKEIERYRQLQQERVENILKADTESLFKIEEITPEIPDRAKIMRSEICDFCKESTKVDLLDAIDGKKACIPCAQQHGVAKGLLPTDDRESQCSS
jgi:formylmethanofuran dehydrogenase subunit E